MYNIAICIPTYKRPLMLKKLVLSIRKCKQNRSMINNVHIIIIDNDPGKTAESTVSHLSSLEDKIFKLSYFVCPDKGLSNVRNKLLKKAISLKPDFVVFIDDDEYATPNWLNELVYCIVKNKGDMARGPVISEFDKTVPKYVSCWFENPNYPNDEQVKTVETNNLIISNDFLLKSRISFNNRFNTTGGEDTYFGIEAIKSGAKIYWARKAIVHESIPVNRAKLKWLIKRKFREGVTFTYILILEKRYLNLSKKISVNILYLILGSIALALTPFTIKLRYWGILKIVESIGGFAGLFNIKYHEYSRSENS